MLKEHYSHRIQLLKMNTKREEKKENEVCFDFGLGIEIEFEEEYSTYKFSELLWGFRALKNLSNDPNFADMVLPKEIIEEKIQPIAKEIRKRVCTSLKSLNCEPTF